jgi:hypothetical protein
MKRAQGAFEYILMLSGVLLVVILIVLILQGSLNASNNTLAKNQNTYGNAVSIQMVNHKTAGLTVLETTGNVNATTFPCCANGIPCPLTNGTALNMACNYSSGTTLSCQSRYFNNVTGTCA